MKLKADAEVAMEKIKEDAQDIYHDAKQKKV